MDKQVASPAKTQVDNPYAAPMVLDDPVEFVRTDSLPNYRVEGDYLVIGKSAVLPPICVFTGEPLDSGYMVKVTLVSRFISGRDSFKPFLANPSCDLTYGVSRRIYKLKRQTILYRILLTLAIVALYPVFAQLGLIGKSGTAIWSIAIFVCIYLTFNPGKVLKCERYEKKQFWISGISKTALNHFRQEADKAFVHSMQSNGR